MHTFSPTPTQYEIESWIFPHPSVRQLQDASNPGPQRHSLHYVTPRVRATQEEEERARLKKGHRRWHSNENRILHGGPHGSKENKSKGESLRTGSLKTTLEWLGPRGRHSGLTTQDGKAESSQRDRHSPEHHLVACDGNSQDKAVVVNQGRTKCNSKQGIVEPKHHSSALRVPAEGEKRSKGGRKISHSRRRHSQGHLVSMLTAETRIEKEEVKGLSRGQGSVKGRRARIQSRLCDTPYGMPFQAVSKVRPSEFLGGQVSPSLYRQHKQPWASKLSAPLPSTQHRSLTRQPSHSSRQSAIALKFHPEDSRALSRSLSCRSWTMGAELGPSEGVDSSTVSQNVTGGHQGSLEDSSTQHAPGHQYAAESDGEDEPNPAFLGSLDYHDFLHGTSKWEAASLQNTPPVTGTALSPSRSNVKKIEAALGDDSAPRTVLNDKSAHESPVSRFAHKVTQSLPHKPFPDTIKPATTLRERRGQALAEKTGSPEALRRLPKPELSVLTDIPFSLTSSTISPSSSLTTAPLLREGTLRSIPSGPLSTISSKEIDPEKLQPFIGPLLPQQPPPDQPLPQLPFPSPVKRRDPIMKLAPSMAGQVDDSKQGVGKGDKKRSMDEATEQHVDQKKGKGLRKKISRFFLNDQPARPTDAMANTTYQPLSLTASQDTERLSLSDIFDDVYNAARSSLKPGRGSHNSGRSSYQKSDRISVSAQPGDFILPIQTEHHGTHDTKGALATLPNASYQVESPPLIGHAVIRANLEIQDRLGLEVNANAAAIPSPGIPVLPLGVPGLPVSRHHPAQNEINASSCSFRPVLPVTETASKARLVKEESQATITADIHQDIDPSIAFDRTVDLTWYRTAREERATIICSVPRPSGRFEHVLTLFVAQYAKGRPFKKYNGKKRFPYFDLPNKIRFEVMRHLVADTNTGKPILLNSQRQASPAWPADAFVSLGSVLKPLQSIMWACPRLRAEVMVLLLLTRKFHVIFSPWVKECTQPLPTTWLFRYLHLMQDVSLEIDMTKLGFGHSWESTAMDASLRNISGLICRFTEEMLTRNSANSMGRLTIHCRRYFGYRQGPNTVRGRQGAYKHPLIGGEEDEPRSIVPGEDDSARNGGQPRNYNRRAPSLPPSAAKLYSGHLRHHADLPHRVPYVTENQLSVASPLRALTGRVDSVRMVGFSEQWTYATHLDMWPEAERNAVSDAVKHYHIDRQTPSRHSYVAPGHAIYLDYGIDHGVHRYPPLPDSEPMVCVDYDRENGLFLELGSGNVVSATNNGAEIHFRSLDPPTPSCISASVPRNLTSPAHRDALAFVPQASLIPTPSSRGRVSPMMQAMRKGTPVKAAAVLGLPGTMVTRGENEPLATPTKSRTTRKTRAETGHDTAHGQPRTTAWARLPAGMADPAIPQAP